MALANSLTDNSRFCLVSPYRPGRCGRKSCPFYHNEVSKKKSKLNGLKLVLNMIDLTTLEGKDTDGKVKQLCYKAIHLHDAIPGLPTVAASMCLSFHGKDC